MVTLPAFIQQCVEEIDSLLTALKDKSHWHLDAFGAGSRQWSAMARQLHPGVGTCECELIATPSPCLRNPVLSCEWGCLAADLSHPLMAFREALLSPDIADEAFTAMFGTSGAAW
jgi:hypothetical protein